MSGKSYNEGNGQEYWIISCALGESGKEAIFEELVKNLKMTGLCTDIFGFEVPYNLKFGAFDDLVVLADDLAKHDTNVDVILRRVERLAHELDNNIELRIIWQRSSYSIEQYLRHFNWDHAKFPKERSMKENVNSLLQSVQKLDHDLRVKSTQLNELQHTVNNSAIIIPHNISNNSKFVVNSNFITKELTDLICPSYIDDEDVVNMEHIRNVFIVIPKGQLDSFKKSYEFLDNFIVPKSLRTINNIVDKDGNSLVHVLIFKSSIEDFKQSCKSKKFTVRDDFHYSSERYKALMERRDKLYVEKDKQEKYFKKMCFASFSDIFISWMHIKAMRCFVEAVLRYGVHPQFSSYLLQLPTNNPKTPKIKSLVEKSFVSKGKLGRVYNKSTEIEDDYTSYVLLSFYSF